MRRNFIGSSLALLLLAVIAMKQVALGFCLCDTSYFLDSCICQDEVAPAPCNDHCSGDHHEEPDAPAPCDDCETSVSLDSGDYLWSPLADLHPSFDVSEIPAPPFATLQILSSEHLLRGTSSPRGSPPDSCALFLRHQSLRL